MKEIYNNWPKSFVDGLDFLRGKDATYLTHPVYVERSAELFNSLYTGVLEYLAPDNSPELYAKFTIHDLRLYQRMGASGDPIIDSLVRVSRSVADALRIAENIHDTECLFFCLAVVHRDESEAWHYFHRVIRPIVMMRRIRDVMQIMGERGGKPRHRLFGEAMLIALAYQRRHPTATYSAVAKYVRGELLVKHHRVPAQDTIRRWLREF